MKINRSSRRILVFLTACLAFSSATFANTHQKPKEVLVPKMTPELNIGKMNYDAFCASCHGAHTTGTDKGPTFLHRVYHPGHHGDGAFYLAAKNGVRAHHWPFGDMPPVDGVSDPQIEKIVIYVRAIQQANGLF